MSGFKVDISGDLNEKFKEITEEAKKIISNEIYQFGQDTVDMAKALAPTDEGILKASITYTRLPEPDIGVEISVAASYAAYIEFGTRGFAAAYVATLPQNWQQFAAQFKGKGQGDYFDFLNAILDWVIRKGIAARYSVKTKRALKIKIGSGSDDESRLHDAAYAIALSIIRHGIKPHPYLFPAIEEQRKQLLDRLKAQLG